VVKFRFLQRDSESSPYGKMHRTLICVSRMENWRQSPLILNLGTGWSEWSASRPYRFHPGADPRYALNGRLAVRLCRETNHDFSAKFVVCHYTHCMTPIPVFLIPTYCIEMGKLVCIVAYIYIYIYIYIHI
jgi:hypothetical protein